MPVLVEQLAFCEGGAFPKGDDAALRAHRSARVGKRTMIGNLQLERGVALSGQQPRVHRAGHHRIEHGRRIAAMHGAERVVDRPGGKAFEHHEALFG
jgi:hypothetical protein